MVTIAILSTASIRPEVRTAWENGAPHDATREEVEAWGQAFQSAVMAEAFVESSGGGWVVDLGSLNPARISGA